MFVLGVIVGATITCIAGIFALAWVSAKAYELGRRDQESMLLEDEDE